MRLLPLAASVVVLGGCHPSDAPIPLPVPRHEIKVLDGDTLIFDGTLVRIAGIDAPELGPWAKCWAEAGLGGASRDALVSATEAPGARNWALQKVGKTDGGALLANLTADDGEDLADVMVVNGYAARTDGRWRWCDTDADLHQPLQDEPAPHGPNLWWPSKHMYDKRAGD